MSAARRADAGRGRPDRRGERIAATKLSELAAEARAGWDATTLKRVDWLLAAVLVFRDR